MVIFLPQIRSYRSKYQNDTNWFLFCFVLYYLQATKTKSKKEESSDDDFHSTSGEEKPKKGGKKIAQGKPTKQVRGVPYFT